MSSTPLPLIRPLAIPVEHGGWGFLLEPIALGMLVAPSIAGALIAGGVVLAFLARHPLKLAAQDWMRDRRYPRTGVCELLALAYGGTATTFLGGAVLLGGWRPMMALAAALPLALIQFFFDVRKRGRAFVPEIAGVIASGSTAMAVALVTRSLPFAAALWILMLARAVPSVLYVRSALRGESRAVMVVAHVIAIGVAAAVGPITAIIAMSLLLLRAIMPARGLPARTIGMREFVWGACTVVLLAIR